MIGALIWAAAIFGAPEATVLDLRQPGNVVSALQAAGYKAELKIDDGGEPYILSGANGRAFTVEFYDCAGLKDCGSFQFTSWRKNDPRYTAALLNEWNATRRFLKVGVDADGDLCQFLDVTAIGGMTQAQFIELVRWYSKMDRVFAEFLEEKRRTAG